MNKMKSMTGYGRAEGEVHGRKFHVEVRSINSKNLDLICKLPFDLRELESEFRARISAVLGRGKVECYLGYLHGEDGGAGSLKHLNKEQVKAYMSDFREVTDVQAEYRWANMLLGLPGVVSESAPEVLTEDDKVKVLNVLGDALVAADTCRLEEGRVLAGDFVKRVAKIEELADAVEPFERERVPVIRARLEKQLAEWENVEKTVDRNRLEQEMIYYLEKLDITEEKVRLHKHCHYFLETMKEEASGHKLAFIAQEMGREINTLGSKANEVNIQRLVVEMKDELEKIKEQLFNIL